VSPENFGLESLRARDLPRLGRSRSQATLSPEATVPGAAVASGRAEIGQSRIAEIGEIGEIGEIAFRPSPRIQL
jgi:hypothetical protein